ncbi:ATP-NAD kinase-like domain-containing protein [Suillus bovinus]|uniref:ATP-NAD kinase-like domain-containing protein n=1 Tax=Suillus bovinus TaxID=48563 RepID=UPI001B884353|nr:ATP-NAD kinase-like domain-containing protein [Suillus bovinus]KAG2134405.1 ATP-NAD kinase-like domain-containing protein [Suillus bovinus]
MNQVLINSRGVSTSLRFNDASFFIEPTTLDGHKSSCCAGIYTSRRVKRTEVPLRNVISAQIASGALEVQYLVRKSKKSRLNLAMTSGTVQNEDSTRAKKWCEALLLAAYQGANPSKNLKVLVNPHGGKGKGRASYVTKVEPILLAAGCTLDVTYTTHGGHAIEIAREMKLGYDALVLVSGDGLIHEVLNGIDQHEHRDQAFCIPIAPIPTGSGNGMSLNLLGLQDGLDVCAAALNVLKGQPLKTDLFSFAQGDRRRISFMSQTIGITADIDIETEHLRWMGDTRFIIGYISAVIARKSCPIELSMKVVDQDKSRMVDVLHARRAGESPTPSSLPSSLLSADNKPDSASSVHREWTQFKRPILWMYAGKGPFVSRALMQFPVSIADDGLIDIAIQEITSRRDLLRAMDGAEEGRTYWKNTNQYFKVSAYRARPLAPKGTLVVDGEQVPFEEFEVDVLNRLGTFLSPFPHYAPEFLVRDIQGNT